MDDEILQPKTAHKRRENSKLQDLQRQEGSEECIYNLSEQIVRDIVLTCVVLHNMLRTHKGGVDMTPTQADDTVTLQNEQVMYVPDDNHRNSLKETKHQ